MKMGTAVRLLSFLAVMSFVCVPSGVVAQNAGKTDGPLNLSGFWRVVANVDGAGLFTGRMTVRRWKRDVYRVTYQLVGRDDTPLQRSGAVTVKNGTEWRGTLVSGDHNTTEEATVSPDGNAIKGSWRQTMPAISGGRFHAVRMAEGVSAIMAVSPRSLAAGEAAELTLHGTGMTGPVSLGAGVRITRTVIESPVTIILEVRVAKDAAPGPRTVAVGAQGASRLFAIQKIISPK